MKKCIWVEFPDDFTPPEKFDGVEEVGLQPDVRNVPSMYMIHMIRMKIVFYQTKPIVIVL